MFETWQPAMVLGFHHFQKPLRFQFTTQVDLSEGTVVAANRLTSAVENVW